MKRHNTFKTFVSKCPSKTKPNRALTCRQIDERYRLGKLGDIRSKVPIHEPYIDGISPMRQPYCDYTDVMAYGEHLNTQLNKTTAVYDEKRKAFDNAVSKARADERAKLFEEFKKQHST